MNAMGWHSRSRKLVRINRLYAWIDERQMRSTNVIPRDCPAIGIVVTPGIRPKSSGCARPIGRELESGLSPNPIHGQNCKFMFSVAMPHYAHISLIIQPLLTGDVRCERIRGVRRGRLPTDALRRPAQAYV